MLRTQIRLTEEQRQGLRRWAHRLGISMSEAVRRCVEDVLGREKVGPTRGQCIDRALAVCGKYRDPAGLRVAEDHDRYLAGAFDE